MSTPRRVLRPGLTWPIVVGKPRQDGQSEGRGGGAEERQREVRVTGAGEGEPIPAVYGRAWVGGRLMLVGKADNDIVLAYAVSLALNGIDAFEQVLVDGKTSINGVTIRTYSGAHTTVPVDISAAYPSHSEQYKGLALVTLRISPFSDIFGGIPEVRCLVKGRKVWNGTAFAYSANPALIAYDVLVAGDMGARSSGVDWASFSNAAAYYDQLGTQFATIVASLANSFAVAKDIMEAAEGVLFADNSGTIKAAALRDDLSATIELGDAELVAEDGFEQAAQLDTLFGGDSPNYVRVRFQDADRMGEESIQTWQSPRWTFFGGPIYADDFQSPFVTDAIQAARMAENIGARYLAYLKAARVRVLAPKTPGEVVRMTAHGLALPAISSDAGGVAMTGASSEPTTILRLAASFILDSAAGGTIIRHGTPGTNGFELRATASGLTVTIGAASSTLSVSLPVGVPIKVALFWKANSTTIFWGINGVALRSTIAAVASAAANTNDYLLIQGFAGKLLYLQVYSGSNAAATVYASAVAPSLGAGTIYILGDGTANMGTITSGTVTKSHVGLPFWVTRCKPLADFTYELELREWQFWSRADAQVMSTNDVVVSRIDSKPSLALPDHSEVPPPPSGVAVQAIERNTSQGSQYEISVTWSPSPSTFIRGYRVYCVVGGIDQRFIGEYGRNANGCQFWAFAVGVSHQVRVTAVSNTGKESAPASASVTPGQGTLAVTNLSASWTRKEMGIKVSNLDKWYTGGILHLQWSVTGTASQIVVSVGGQVVARLGGDARSLEVARGFADGMWSVSGFGEGGDQTPRVQAHFDQGMAVAVTAIAADGRSATASTSVPAPSSSATLFSPAANEPLIGNGAYFQSAHYVAGGIPAAPSAGDWHALLSWQRNSQGAPISPRWLQIAYSVVTFFNAGTWTWNPGTGQWIFILDAESAKDPAITIYSISSTSITLQNSGGQRTARVVGIRIG